MTSSHSLLRNIRIKLFKKKKKKIKLKGGEKRRSHKPQTSCYLEEAKHAIIFDEQPPTA